MQLISFEDTLELMEESALPGLMTAEEHSEMLAWESEHEAEVYAESAWLRHAENLGWEEAYIESLIESGLRSPWAA